MKLVFIFSVLAIGAFAQPPLPVNGFLPATIAESNLVVRAADEAAAANGMKAVHLLHAEVCDLLTVTSPPPRFVAWFTDTNAWSLFSAKSGDGVEGRGLAGAASIAVLSEPDDANETLAHELVHLVLKKTSSGPLPLWFEEGCASYFGWRAAQAVARAQGRALVRTQPALNPAELLTHDVLLGCLNYPATPAANRAFYRQSEELVRLFDERLGDAGVHKLSVLLVKNNDLRDCLKSEFGYRDGDLNTLDQAVDVRSTTRQER